MKTGKIIMIFAASVMSTTLTFAESMSETIDRAMKAGQSHAKNMLVALDSQKNAMPKTFEKGKLVTSKVNWWCSGFFPGTLWYMYEFDKDPAMKAAAEKYTDMISQLFSMHTDHDIGFQFYCSYGNGFRLTANEDYKKNLISAAKILTKRFKPETGVIRSWDSNNKGKWQYPVIIDNMMNLELLEFASKASGNPEFDRIARTHADTTMRNHFRPDNSCYHVVSYDTKTGIPHLKQTWQGLSDDSSWSRGQAWALYGFTMMYRETRAEKYLQHAEKIANFIIKHPNLPADKVPYWDFDAPKSDKTLRDASAAAIMASAFVELSTLAKNPSASAKYRKIAEQQITSLASDKYLAPVGSNGNFMLKHSVGAIPFKNEIDVSLTYTDYYFVEAMLRLKHIIEK